MQVLVASTATKEAHSKGKSGDDEGDGRSCKGGDEMVGSGGEEDPGDGEGDGSEADSHRLAEEPSSLPVSQRL